MMKNFTQKQWSYLAGIVDVIGDFPSINLSVVSGAHSDRYLRYSFKFAIMSKNDNFMKELGDLLNLKLKFTKPRFPQPERSINTISGSYRILFKASMLEEFFTNILPYAKVFKKEIEVVIKFRKTFSNKHKLEKLSDEVLLERELLMNELKNIRDANEFINE